LPLHDAPRQSSGAAAQSPMPSHVPAGVKAAPLHDPLPPHAVPEATCSQTPPAAQLPVFPQGGLAAHWPGGAAVPGVAYAQLPSGAPVSAIVHARHVPVQATSQHTPSAQKPLVHWRPSPLAQLCPFPLAATQWPDASQKSPLAQSPSCAQLDAQTEPAQAKYGAQLVGEAARQVPAPSQGRAGVAMPPAQIAGAHTVPIAYSRHAPLPSHAPSVPHDEAPWSAHWPSGSVPATTLPHTPSAPAPLAALLHAWQVPPQAVLQQTPLAQKPLAHWSPAVHAAPFPFVGVQVPPALLGSQKSPATQSESCAQATHTFPAQTPLSQSPATLQPFAFAHGGHEPPQSTPVSVPSWRWSLHVAGAHTLEMQTSVPVQSAVTLHPTQDPPPLAPPSPPSLQTFPP
jgi:hypothetical protein